VRDAKLIRRSALGTMRFVGREGIHGMEIDKFWHRYHVLRFGRWVIVWPRWLYTSLLISVVQKTVPARLNKIVDSKSRTSGNHSDSRVSALGQ
jgi:hypothetical protein